MRIHTDNLSPRDLMDASRIAGTDLEFIRHNSRSRDHAYEVKMTGDSRRRPMGGGPDFAATWDQWGVFLSVLFDRDHTLTIPRVYGDRYEFDSKTVGRFVADQTGNYWPADAHGDHRFRYSGTPYQQECVKCSAVQCWAS